VVTDRTGRVLLQIVGRDDQWRQPVPLDKMSPWLSQAIIAAEDERFSSHRGIDPIAVGRAAWQNVQAGKTVSGASTLTMQLCRMADDRPRTWRAKMIESFRALQLERLRTKDELLAAYLNVAPFGGNIRGVEMASRAYFGKRAGDLSLGEAATLAGLPKSPGRFRPDRHPDAARLRRDFVLRRMVELGFITTEQQTAAASEPVCSPWGAARDVVRGRSVFPASHAAWLALQRRPAGGQTTVDITRQHELQRLADEHSRSLPPGSDLAVVAIDVASGDIVALVGSADPTDPIDGQVNGVTARRSPGSTLKPFLYAAAFDAQRLAADSVLDDVPIERAGWSPENFDRTFEGSVTADEALRRSLNVPAILITEELGLPRCVGVIESVGINLPDDTARRGGLAVAVGAVEVTLLDLTNGFATLGRGGVRQAPRLFLDDASDSRRVLDPAACATVNDILSSPKRPATQDTITADASTSTAGAPPWFMWKTGTSSGRRDAWAVGHNERFAVGVWAGRFSGGGHVDYVGRDAAEPLLRSIFSSSVFRNSRVPDPPPTLTVTRPLSKPAPLIGSLRITAPANGAVFVAPAGRAIIHPRLSRTEAVTWFLNDRLLNASPAERIELESGSYQLRCVAASGQFAEVRFRVE
jgi:penicillin-binding protein 1C